MMMKAYAVFAGGGVKGAALAGALAAAQSKNINYTIDFQGFGGTSAGAIVGALASVGFTGEEICARMKSDAHPKQLLDDQGVRLDRTLGHLNRASKILKTKWWKWLKLKGLLNDASPELRILSESYGLYSGKTFQKVILSLLNEKLQLGENVADVTFEDLEKAGCPELRIIASNLSQNRAIRFSRHDPECGPSVIDAVTASAGYPFLFQPRELKNQHRLTDGGLSSNLPAFLFADEFKEKKCPTIAFDLVNAEMSGDGALFYIQELMETALTASDHLLQQVVPGIIRVDIPIPPDISTLKFSLTDGDIDNLFNAGFTATVAALAELRDFVEDAKSESAENVRQLATEGRITVRSEDIPELSRRQELQVEVCARYGERRLIEPPLWAFARMIEENSAAKEIRANIMLPTFEEDDERIIAYSYGFRLEDRDRLLLLTGGTGCTGAALEERSPMCASLDGDSQKEWGLTEEEIEQVANDRRSLLCAPIFERPLESGEDPILVPIMGVLSVDSATELEQTQWLTGDLLADDMEIRREIVEIIVQWSDILSRLLASGVS